MRLENFLFALIIRVRGDTLHEKEVAAHSSSGDDGSNADSKISLHTVAQYQFSFLSPPSKALSPWSQVTKGWVRFRPFELGHPFDNDDCHQNLPGAYLAYICWWLMLRYNLGSMSLNMTVHPNMTKSSWHIAVIEVFLGAFTKRVKTTHPSTHPLYPLLPALWVCGVLLKLIPAAIGQRWQSKMETVNGWNVIETIQCLS